MNENLLKNVKQFVVSADLVYNSGDYTSAAMLYFKALFVGLDIMLLKAVKKSPKDHAERFRMLEASFPEEYVLLDRYFNVYQSTYTITIDKSTAEEVRNYVKRTLSKHLGI